VFVRTLLGGNFNPLEMEYRMDVAAELDALLSEDVDAARVREANAYERVAGPRGQTIVLFGAGGLGQRTLSKLRSIGVEPVAFADNNQARWGTDIEGVSVLSPEQAAAEFGGAAAFVVTIWGAGSPHRFKETADQLHALGCEVVVPFAWFAWRFADRMLPYYGVDLPSRLLEQAEGVRAAFSLMSDDQSRREYVAQVRWRLSGDPGCLDHPVDEPQYLAGVASITDGESILDCGAYDGDTLRSWVETKGDFARYVGLEPDPESRRRLDEEVERLPEHLIARVVVLPYAVASEEGTSTFSAGGTGASSLGNVGKSGGDMTVECRRIDQLVAQLGKPFPSLLKMDIEGAELDALNGAVDLIEQEAPVLALCVYHRQSDLWTIPLFAAGLRKDYRFYLRPHNEEGWDLVCYGVPESRVA
jgi:FkbM family methyltransferase